MGAGRKTATYDYDSKSAAQLAQQSFEQRQRNLGENLGGCIFGCTNQTIQECLDEKVFGLPRAHWCYVQWIAKDMPIFLFNYNSRKLHGIFQAESDGEWEVKPAGWCMGSGTKTQFPSQVKVREYKDCEPLADREYRGILSRCFSDDGHLLFELKKEEAEALCRAFVEKTEKLTGKRSAVDAKRPLPSATGANSALAQDSRRAFRPASPPVLSAWGTSSVSRDSREPEKPAPPPPQEPPKPSDFPSLPGASSAGTSAEASNAWGQVSEQPSQPADPAIGREARKNSLKGEGGEAGSSSSWDSKNPGESSGTSVPDAALKIKESAGKLGEAPKSKKPTIPQASTRSPGRSSRGAGPSDAAADISSDSQKITEGPSTLTQERAATGSNGASSSKASHAARSTIPNEEAAVANGREQQSSQVQAGMAQANDEYVAMLENMYVAMRAVDQPAADSVWHLFNHIKSRLERATGDRMVLAQVADVFKREKQALEQLVVQQSHAIGVLKEESAALRRDLAFVGGHMNITVAPVNPAVEALQPLPVIPSQPEGSTYSEGGTGQTGVGPTAESLLLFGGNDMHEWLTSLDVFDPANKQWVVMGQMPSTRGYAAAAAISGHVYLIGGGNGPEWNRDCLRYDVLTNEWFQMAAMEEIRGSLAAVALNGRIYAIGGGKKGEQTARTEVLDPNTNQWMPNKTMHSKRFGVAAGVVGGSIIAAGGFDGDHYLSTTERFDPREGHWEQLPELALRRGGHQVIAAEHELHVLGGWDSSEFLDSAEIFDVRKNEWRAAPPMKTPRAYFGAAKLDGVMYALGGMVTQKAPNEIVEYYDGTASKWKAFYVEPTNEPNGRKRFFVAPCKLEL